MLKAQPRFSGNGGHGKRLVDLDEEVFEKAMPPVGPGLKPNWRAQSGQRAARDVRRTLEAGKGKSQSPEAYRAYQARVGLRTGKANSHMPLNSVEPQSAAEWQGRAIGRFQAKGVSKGLFDTLAAKAPQGFLPNVGDKGVAGLKRSIGRSFKAGKSPDAAASGFKPKSTVNQWAFKAGQSGQAGRIESAYANRKPIAIGAGGVGAVGTGYAVGKAYAPSKQLVAAGRQAEVHAFKTAKPKKLTRNPQKVWDLSKGDNKDVRAVLDGDRKYRQGHALQAGGYASATGALWKWGMQSGGGAPRGKGFWALAGGAPVLVAGGKRRVESGRKQTRRALSRMRARGESTRPDAFGKRARTYDSELNRQRRQGMYVAGGALGGGALVASGGRELRRDMSAGRKLQGDLSELRRGDTRVSHALPKFGSRKDGSLPVGRGAAAKQRVGTEWTKSHPLSQAQHEALERMGLLGSRTSGKTKGKLGAGLALLAGSGGMYRHSRSKANRRWN